MVTYQYRCAQCGPFDLTLPMGEARPEQRCAQCEGTARRVFTAPALTRPGAPLTRALDAQQASRHEPQVVTAPPPARRSPAPPSDPRHALLPRP
ncbi:putative FmdB family regulatory protein [Actinomadura pelletieri DSM 43383]|uniref:Putative FmdB family regulatory protein n=1 Tax=Actinomadura pelletieri DSM 43383 TaxID=1120940 RepID=A0A495QU43_9ACTN|nr:FmdB family zinc ribbon protein [Actinomadura pelletieri]RKS76957.1 putative FmdB family regulatory protein [Actinomadura pelletieri DSM 43383]